MEYRFSELGKSRLGPNPEIDLALEAAKVALARFNCYGTVRKSKIPYREI